MDNNMTQDQQSQDTMDILSGAPQFKGIPSIQDHIAQSGSPMDPSLSQDAESQVEDTGEPQGQEGAQEPQQESPEDVKEGTSTHIEEVNILSSAIKMMNKYAQLIEQDDPTNSKAARSIISVLGELLKSEHYDKSKQGGIL